MTSEFTPLAAFTRALRRWPLIAALTVLGGLTGWLFSLVQPPLYEARALFNITIDLAQTGPLEERDEDHIINAATALMASKPVFALAAEDVVAAGYSPAYAWGSDAFLERQQSRIYLIVRHPDPQAAAVLVNLWAERAFAALTQAHLRALRARDLRLYLNTLSDCAQPNPDPAGICAAASVGEIAHAMDTASAALSAETASSMGINPAILFGLVEKAQPPLEPVAFRGVWLLLAGALAGFIIGIAAAGTRRR